MTGIGKLLVFVNLFFSVGLLAWAVSAYTNRINWLDTTTETGKVPGQISQLKSEIDRLTKAINDAQAGYATKRYLLANSEDLVLSRAAVFETRLDAARNGNFRVQIATDRGAFGEGVMYDITREGPEILGADKKPLRGLKTLQDEFANEARLIEIAMNGKNLLTEEQWQQIISGETNLTQLAELLPDLGISDLRRLHLTLSDLIARDEIAIRKQATIRMNLNDEAAYLSEKRVNANAELQTLTRRERQLIRRIASLANNPANER